MPVRCATDASESATEVYIARVATEHPAFRSPGAGDEPQPETGCINLYSIALQITNRAEARNVPLTVNSIQCRQF